MIRIDAQAFFMGAEGFYPEEAPVRQVKVDGFWIDETPVTNRQFAAFVDATNYVTEAEIAPDPRDYPGMPRSMAKAGSLVFQPPKGPVQLDQPQSWWTFMFGANWRHPLGKGSGISTLQDHPVVHVSHGDAQAYASWAGKQLPSEAEWELAARGGLEQTGYAWGDELAPAGRMMCNYWQGEFPRQNLKLDGFERTSPVRQFAANGLGIHDMIGNVWEWTDDWYSLPKAGDCCLPLNPRGGKAEESYDPSMQGVRIPRKVLKGGSHLCAENYCRRYRPAARIPQMVETSTSHIGFRCVSRDR